MNKTIDSLKFIQLALYLTLFKSKKTILTIQKITMFKLN
jgi:hypothetical protein